MRVEKILERLEKGGEHKRMKKMLAELKDLLQSLAGELTKDDKKMLQGELNDLENTMKKAA